jgi:hypothetical protein
MERHGHVLQTRPADWGLLERHPLYQSWRQHFRKTSKPDPRWLDFSTFVNDVGERPTNRHWLCKLDKKLPIGPDNWYWRNPAYDSIAREDKRAYAREYAKAFRKAHPDYSFNAGLVARYGINTDKYVDLLESQEGVCAICGKPEIKVDSRTKNVRKLSVDHCHNSGKIRGLLCTACNTSLGGFNDSPDLLQKAIEYLRKNGV